MPDSITEDWNVQNLESLDQEKIETLAALKPELVLLGTGDVLRFPDPQLLRCLTHAGIGAEVMDTRAACRTYNVLVGEERHGLVAILLPGPSKGPE